MGILKLYLIIPLGEIQVMGILKLYLIIPLGEIKVMGILKLYLLIPLGGHSTTPLRGSTPDAL